MNIIIFIFFIIGILYLYRRNIIFEGIDHSCDHMKQQLKHQKKQLRKQKQQLKQLRKKRKQQRQQRRPKGVRGDDWFWFQFDIIPLDQDNQDDPYDPYNPYNPDDSNDCEMDCKNKYGSECESDDGWPIYEGNCKKCKNCGWCIDNDFYGTCVKANGNKPNSRPDKCVQGWKYQCIDYGPVSQTNDKCYMGIREREDPDGTPYAKVGCKLYDYYNKCVKCAKENKCLNFNPSSDGGYVVCEDCEYGKPNCLASPDESYGYGCPGQDFSSDNIPPIDPSLNDGVICEFTEK